jgi:hypothetical protein
MDGEDREFRRVPRGKYYVMASHKLFGEELFWLVPVPGRRPALGRSLQQQPELSG